MEGPTPAQLRFARVNRTLQKSQIVIAELERNLLRIQADLDGQERLLDEIFYLLSFAIRLKWRTGSFIGRTSHRPNKY